MLYIIAVYLFVIIVSILFVSICIMFCYVNGKVDLKMGECMRGAFLLHVFISLFS